MACKHCHAKIKKHEIFCEDCKSKFLICAACKTQCNIHDKFCHECGTKLQSDDVHSTKREAKIISVKGDTEELKHVTILFADIKGSTSLVEKLDPEEAHNLLKPLIHSMIDAVYEYKGTVIHTAGDGLSALFGAPTTLEDHGLRACFAALMMQTKVKLLNPEISIRVGLNSGSVLLDVIGKGKHREYDALGSAVNLAARLEQTAEPDHIQMSQATLDLVETYVEAKALPAMQMKGFSDPVKVYNLLKIEKNISAFELSHIRTATLFVGRDKELNSLMRIAKNVAAGQGHAVALIAEAGEGKSRLLYEFTRQLSTWEIVVSAANAYNAAPLFPIMEIFKKILHVHPAMHAEILKEKLLPLLRDITFPFALQAALALANNAQEDAVWRSFSSEQKRKYMFDVGLAILINLSQSKPLMIILEDLHWLDSESESFLNELIKAANHYRILVVVTFRPSFADPWESIRHYTRIPIVSLQSENIKKIMDDFLGNDASLAPIKKRLLLTASGSPFFLEQMLKSLVAEEIVVGEKSAYRFNSHKSHDKIQLPESIYAVMLAQVDRLDKTEKDILQKAAILGDKFSYQVCAELIGEDPKTLRRSLDVLQQKNFIYETKFFPETELGFSHALFQEVVYDSLLKLDRKALHNKALNILGNIYKTHYLEHIETLAHHATLGEIWDKAFSYNLQAAQKAFSYLALRECITFCESALNAVQHVAEDENSIRMRIEIYLMMHIAYLRLGKSEQMKALLDEAMTFAIKINDANLQIAIMANQCVAYLSLGQVAKAVMLGENAYAAAKNSAVPDVMITTEMGLASAYLFAGQHTQVIRKVEELQSLLNENVDYQSNYFKTYVWFLAEMHKLIAQTEMGQFENFLQRERDIIKLLQSRSLGMRHLYMMISLGIMSFEMGDLVKSENYLKKALQFSKEFESRIYLPIAASALGCVQLSAGIKGGEEFINFAIKEGQASDFAFMSIFALRWCVQGLMLSENILNAKQLVTDALQLVSVRGVRGQEAVLLRLAAECELRMDQPDNELIKNYLQNSLQLSQEFNMQLNLQRVKNLLKNNFGN